MEIKLDLSSVKDELEKLDFLARNKVLKFAANEIMRLSDDYVPFDSGTLKNSAYVTELGDEIVYPSPYAQYMYQGKLMVDPIIKKGAFYDPITNRYWSRPGVKKELTDTPLNYAGAPKRGAHWAEKAWEEHKEDVIESIEKYIGSNL